MKPAHPLVISDLREITGHVRPMALANAIHADVPSSCDRWFEEEAPEGFRVSTDSGFSCIVPERHAFCSPV